MFAERVRHFKEDEEETTVMCKAMEDMRMQVVMDDRKRYSMQTFEKGRMYLEEIVRILREGCQRMTALFINII